MRLGCGRRFVGQTMSIPSGVIVGGVVTMMSYGLYQVGQTNIKRRCALLPAARHTTAPHPPSQLLWKGHRCEHADLPTRFDGQWHGWQESCGGC